MVIPFYKHLIQRVAFFANMSICNINVYFRNTLSGFQTSRTGFQALQFHPGNKLRSGMYHHIAGVEERLYICGVN
jgi:hypothetical protein